MEAGSQAYDDITVRLEGSVFSEDPLQDFVIFFFSHKGTGLLKGHPVLDAVGERKVVTVGNQANGIILSLPFTNEGAEKPQFLYMPGEEFHNSKQNDRFPSLRFGSEYVNAFRLRHDRPPLIHPIRGELLSSGFSPRNSPGNSPGNSLD